MRTSKTSASYLVRAWCIPVLLVGLILVQGCGPVFPFVVNLIPFLESDRLEYTVEVAGGSIVIPGSTTPPLSFPRASIPLHDVTIPIDIGLALPRTSIQTAEVVLGVETDILAAPDSLDLDGSAQVSLYLAPDTSPELFVDTNEIRMGTMSIGNGERSTLVASLPAERVADLEGGHILLGLAVHSISVGFPQPPAEDHTLYGFSLSIQVLTIRGEADAGLHG